MIEERNSIEEDCKLLIDDLRPDDFNEVVTMTKEHPLKPVVRGFKTAKLCRSIIKDGNFIAMYGVCPTESHTVGSPFLLGTNRFLEIALPFARQCKDRVQEMQDLYPILWNFIDSRNAVHLRWIKWCGFKIINKKKIEGIDFYEFIKI
ncbi:hypothetical protein N9T79_00030 [Candidatus Pelagibacter sp.]|jgi:hypothetical protein|nr:hypothetical protein [Candidatus Pelagibacter sp.]